MTRIYERYYIYYAIFFALGQFTPAAFSADKETAVAAHEKAIIGACISQLAETKYRIKTNRFNSWREANDYLDVFGGEFIDDLLALPENSHFLDAGAGEAKAMAQLAQGIKFRGQDVKILSRRLTAVAVAKPEVSSVAVLAKLAGREFRYLEGQYIENISQNEIGKVDLLTDLYGPFSYTHQLDTILRKYLELLKVGGKAYINFDPLWLEINGKPENLKGYFRLIKGVSIIWVGKDAVRIEKIAPTTEQSVPDLRLVKFIDASPPHREFVWSE